MQHNISGGNEKSTSFLTGLIGFVWWGNSLFAIPLNIIPLSIFFREFFLKLIAAGCIGLVTGFCTMAGTRLFKVIKKTKPYGWIASQKYIKAVHDLLMNKNSNDDDDENKAA